MSTRTPNMVAGRKRGKIRRLRHNITCHVSRSAANFFPSYSRFAMLNIALYILFSHVLRQSRRRVSRRSGGRVLYKHWALSLVPFLRSRRAWPFLYDRSLYKYIELVEIPFPLSLRRGIARNFLNHAAHARSKDGRGYLWKARAKTRGVGGSVGWRGRWARRA